MIAALSVLAGLTVFSQVGSTLQDRTIDSAHLFLTNAFSRNLIVDHYYDVIDYGGGVGSNGKRCMGVIHVDRGDRGIDTLFLDFSRLSSIETNYADGGALINIPADWRIEDDRAWVYIKFGSDELRARAAAAMLYLRDQCDDSHATGF